MKKILSKEKLKEIEDKLYELSIETGKICTFRKPISENNPDGKKSYTDDQDEMYDRCVEIMNFSAVLVDELRNLTLIKNTLEQNHTLINLLKEKHSMGKLSKEECEFYGFEYSFFRNDDVNAKLVTDRKKKLYLETDEVYSRSKEVLNNVDATIELVKNRIEYCKFIWSPYDRAVSLGFKRG